MLSLKTDRPLAFFDIEATGTNARADRIIDLAVVKVSPLGQQESFSFRVNPERPIPKEASEIHGIFDADVAGAPIFKQVAAKVASILEGCDLAGYNILNYDIVMLSEEFIRAGVPFSMDGRRVVDVQRIFHKREPRDLSAALAFYCGEMHLGAHGAMDDVLATIRVLEGQFDRYRDLPSAVQELSDYCFPRDPTWVDGTGRLKWINGEVCINFGRKQGTPLRTLVENERSFLDWLLRSDFPRDTQEIVRGALTGKYPSPPPPSA